MRSRISMNELPPRGFPPKAHPVCAVPRRFGPSALRSPRWRYNNEGAGQSSAITGYEEVRPILVALAQRAGTLRGARTQTEFSDLIVLRRDELLGPTRIHIRLYRSDPAPTDLQTLSDDAGVLEDNLVVAVSPNRSSTTPPLLPGLLQLGYDDVIGRALDASLIHSRDNLTVDAERLLRTQSDLLEKIHPLALARHIPELAKGILPPDLPATGGSAADALEDLVAVTFSMGFGLSLRREGHANPFEHKPDGYFMTNKPNRIAVMYDCKSTAKQKLVLSGDDELRFGDYIKGRKVEIEKLENAELRDFVVFASEVGGDFEVRVRRMLANTGIHLCVVLAKPLAGFCTEMYRRALAWRDILALVDWPRILAVDVVGDREFKAELKRLDDAFQSRF